MPPDAQEIISLRIVVRPHVNQELTEILVRDIEGACEYLEQHVRPTCAATHSKIRSSEAANSGMTLSGPIGCGCRTHPLRIDSDMLVVRALKISQLTDGGMPSTHDSMHKTLGHFSRDKR